MAYNSRYTGIEIDAAIGKVQELSSPANTYHHTFAVADWGDSSRIVIPAGVHGIAGTDVVCVASALLGGSYAKDVWAAKETTATMDSSDKSITLTCSEPYDGAVLLIG